LPINVCRAKKLTNMRNAAAAESSEKLSPPVVLSLEQALDFLTDDELLEVTPLHLRLRKRLLTHDERNRARKQAALRTPA
jgi:GTP-binding protein